MRNKSMYLLFSLMLMIVPCQHVFAQASGGVIIGPPAKPSKPNNPSKPKTGTLSITSTPSDVAIKLDGEYMGTTPLKLKNRKPGTYKVTFSAEGYETITKSVIVTAGKTATCSATLSKKQVQQSAVELPTATSTGTSTATPTTSSSIQTITVNGVSFKMVQIEGGTFQMGSTSGDDDEKPVHEVKVSNFSIGQTEVTQELWEAVMGTNPSRFKGNNRPVETVSWNDCQTFITKLNQLTGKTFRLPTEAEWEYAARGGNKSRGCEYSGSNTLDEVAWYYRNAYDGVEESSPDYGTHNVKTKLPNELGIYDMSGNVFEWCQDWYSRNYYSESVVNNPKGPSSGSSPVFRGGSWVIGASNCRVADRFADPPSFTNNYRGLRLAL